MKLVPLSLFILTGLLPAGSAISADVVLTNRNDAGGSELIQTDKKAVEEVDWELIENRLVARGSILYTYWAEFKTRSGVYVEVEVKAADPVGITIMHRGGVKEIEYLDLSKELQTQLMYDPQEAREFKAGKRQPYLTSERRRSVQDRIAAAQLQRHEMEAATLTQQQEEYSLANERRVKAKQVWSDARELLLRMENEFHQRKSQKSLGLQVGRQKQIVARCEALYRKAQAAYEAMPNPLLR
jgi:hypothetical protein